MTSEDRQGGGTYLRKTFVWLSDAVSAALVVTVTVLVIVQVVWRYFLNHSLTWTESFATVGIIWLAVASGIGTEGRDSWIRLEWMDRALANLGLSERHLYLMRRAVVFVGATALASSNVLLSQEFGKVELLGTGLGRDLIHLVIGGLFGVTALLALVRGGRVARDERLLHND